MLIKVRKLGPTFSNPEVLEKHHELTIEAQGLGELVKVPEQLCEAAELLVGELSMTFFPVGIEVRLEQGNRLNGLWVQRGVLDHVRNSAAVAA